MTVKELQQGMRWVVWYANSIGYEKFKEDLEEILCDNLSDSYVEEKWLAFRKDVATWLCNVDDDTAYKFIKKAVDKYSSKK